MRAVDQLRVATLLEGISLLGLLFVAMPLKYFAHLPAAVRVAGSVHGLLFLFFVGALFDFALQRRWPLRRSLGALAAAALPFGAFLLARDLRRDESTDVVKGG